MAQVVKNLLAMQETQVQSRGRENPLEKGMTTHSSILAWEIKAGLIWDIICISLVAQMGKNLLAMQETQVQSLGQEDPLVKGMVIHFNILA